MQPIPFNSIPDHARAWVFAASQPVVGDDAQRLLSAVDDFVSRWAAHGQPVVGSSDWRHDHFLIVAADEEATGVSGCSIDSLFNTLKDLERTIGVSLMDASNVWYRDSAGHVAVASRGDFRSMVEAGEVGPETVVFNNTVGSVAEIRGGEWECAMADSWHARAFGMGTPAR